MKVILVFLFATYCSALTENTFSLKLGSNPSISISSDKDLGIGLGVAGDADSAHSVSISSQGNIASSGSVSSRGDTASEVDLTAGGGASSEADVSADDGSTSSVKITSHKFHVHAPHIHGLGLWAKIHELQHLLKDNSNNWNSEAVQAWIQQNGSEFPKLNWANITLNNGQGFKISQLFGAIRSAQVDASKQLQALLAENSNDWNSEAITKWIADNGAKFHVNWSQIVSTNGKDFKIEDLLDKFTIKKRFDAIQQLQKILGDASNDWKSDAVTKWIADFGAKFKGIDWQKIVADNGKNFSIDSTLGHHIQHFRAHDLHTRLADNDHKWNSESVQQWIKEYGTQFPGVDWTAAVNNNGDAFNWHKLHAHTHSVANRNPASQLIKILADNNNDWSAEAVGKWITDFGAKYPDVKWSDVVAANGAAFNWDQLLTKHINGRFGPSGLGFWPSFAPGPAYAPGFGGFGGGFGGFSGFGAYGAGVARGASNSGSVRGQALGFGAKTSGSAKLNAKKAVSASGSAGASGSSTASAAVNSAAKILTAANVALPSASTTASLNKNVGLNLGSGTASSSGLNLGLGGGSSSGLSLGLGGGSNAGLSLGLGGGSSDGFVFGSGASRSTGGGNGFSLGLGSGLGANSGFSFKASNKAATDVDGAAAGSVSV